MAKFRRPAQIKPDQLESIQGEGDVAYNSEIAHTSAQALLPFETTDADREVRERVLELIREEGVDVVAESWIRSPEDSLPGALWRGYLLREWIRRYPDEVKRRWSAAIEALRAQGADGEQKISMTPSPQEVEEGWNAVFSGGYDADFAQLLAQSARITNMIGEIDPEWIDADGHPLATDVTRRDRALIETSEEFRIAGAQAERGLLE